VPQRSSSAGHALQQPSAVALASEQPPANTEDEPEFPRRQDSIGATGMSSFVKSAPTPEDLAAAAVPEAEADGSASDSDCNVAADGDPVTADCGTRGAAAAESGDDSGSLCWHNAEGQADAGSAVAANMASNGAGASEAAEPGSAEATEDFADTAAAAAEATDAQARVQSDTEADAAGAANATRSRTADAEEHPQGGVDTAATSNDTTASRGETASLAAAEANDGCGELPRVDGAMAAPNADAGVFSPAASQEAANQEAPVEDILAAANAAISDARALTLPGQQGSGVLGDGSDAAKSPAAFSAQAYAAADRSPALRQQQGDYAGDGDADAPADILAAANAAISDARALTLPGEQDSRSFGGGSGGTAVLHSDAKTGAAADRPASDDGNADAAEDTVAAEPCAATAAQELQEPQSQPDMGDGWTAANDEDAAEPAQASTLELRLVDAPVLEERDDLEPTTDDASAAEKDAAAVESASSAASAQELDDDGASTPSAAAMCQDDDAEGGSMCGGEMTLAEPEPEAYGSQAAADGSESSHGEEEAGSDSALSENGDAADGADVGSALEPAAATSIGGGDMDGEADAGATAAEQASSDEEY